MRDAGVWAVIFGLAVAPSAADAEEQHEEEREPALTTEELRSAYPDLQLQATPPTALTISFTSIYPFQELGVALGADVYALPRLRLSGLFSAGATSDINDEWHGSFYAEAGIGVAMLRWSSEATVELPVPAARFRYQPEDDAPRLRAIVPSSHSLELEVGVLTGRYPFYRCTANCTSNADGTSPTQRDAGLQETLPYAGLRYVYYRRASSEQAPFRSLSGVQVAVDALINASKPPDASLFNLYNDHPFHSPVGARIALRVPAVRCFKHGPCSGFNLMAGYLPNPSDALFSINLEIE